MYSRTSYVEICCNRTPELRALVGLLDAPESGVSGPPALPPGDLTGVCRNCPLVCRLFATILLARPNQLGKPWRRLKPPGGRRSSSVALTVPLSCMSVVYMNVVNGVISGWNISVENVTRGGREG
jgi:hypothetical protein